MKDLYLCENLPVKNAFQIIYQDTERTWALFPARKVKGLSRLWTKFYQSWDYSRKLSLGGDHRILAGIFSSISSWTVALSCIEDFQEYISENTKRLGISMRSSQLTLPRFTKKPVSEDMSKES
ncbi:MAG: hypothetical protein ACFFD2_06925 [Promethearchaeota archaeon]